MTILLYSEMHRDDGKKPEYLAVAKDSCKSFAFDITEGETIEQNIKDIQNILHKYGTELDHIEEKRTYFWLPLDYYNQPDGTVKKIDLFPLDYLHIKNVQPYTAAYPYYYIYEDEMAAYRRAQD